MTSKISIVIIQTLFIFLAITFMSFFADVIFFTSKGASFSMNYSRWISAEFEFFKVFLRLLASGIYVLIRNRRILFRN